MVSKSCGLKGVQKVFYLQQDRIASCCRADADVLDPAHGFDYYLKKWHQESQLLDAGVELSGCDHCWRQEKAGKISYRFSTQNQENQIELYLSNLCNQMCSYCSPKFSSVWEDSIKNHGMLDKISHTAKLNLQTPTASKNTDHWINQISAYIADCEPASVHVKILGGEPLMQQRNLEKLLQLNSDRIKTLGIHTNLNPPNNKFLTWLLQHIDTQTLSFSVSIDASPDHNQWPRARFDQAQFTNNLLLLKQHQVQTVFTSVISVLSVFDLKNFIVWAQQQGIDIRFSKLYNPNCLEATLIPKTFREKIWQDVKDLNPPVIVQEILCQDDCPDNLRLIEQYNYLAQYFERNNLDPQTCQNSLFKEYWIWLTNHRKS